MTSQGPSLIFESASVCGSATVQTVAPTSFASVYISLLQKPRCLSRGSSQSHQHDPYRQGRGVAQAAHRDSSDMGNLSWGFLDRKSTRLNSSHMSISYAVFCLKKKKKK